MALSSSSDHGSQDRPRRPSVKVFNESNVDGFAEGEPVWVAFCDECGAKLTAEEHAQCPYNEQREVDEQGNVLSFHCRRCRR